MAIVETKALMIECVWCRGLFAKNPAKANHECCSPKCRAARWRARLSKSGAIMSIEKRLADHDRRLEKLEGGFRK